MSDSTARPVTPSLEQQGIRDEGFHPEGAFVEFPREDLETSVPERFEKIVRLLSERIAVEADGRLVTYSELNAMANRVAHRIVAERGTAPEPVALLIDKGIEQIAAMLGILKAGKFFVPIDPSYPLERMLSVIRDSQTALLIVDRRNFSTAKQITGSDCQLSALEAMLSSNQTENLCVSVLPTAFACLIYTAGSTGKPKGVIRDHRGVLHGAMLRVHSDGVSSNDRLGHITAGTANAITNSFYVLLHGATLVAFDVGKEGVTRLASWLVDAKITICLIASPLFRKLCAALTGNEKFPTLRYLRLRSDTVYQSDVDLFKRYFPPTCLLANGLALSETGPLREYQIGRNTVFPGPEVPVGYALDDKEVLLVDDNGNEVATNEIGEIVVRSKYLAAGYWNNSQLHEAKFKRDPQDPEKRLFYTGDLGLILPDGCLIHKGRKDSRIKIRGYGVDLLEVEKALRSYKGMKDIVVVSQNENNDARLVAYYTTHIETRPTVSDLRHYLQNKLADYMIPSAFVNLKEIPVTPGGKIDRKALPEPDNRRPDLKGPYVLPSTEMEKRLSRIWSEVLCLDRVGVQDNFFDLGGHSLTASRLMSRVLDSFQVDLPLKSLFESPTLAGFAQRVEDALHGASYGTVLPLIPVPRDESLPASFGQRALWFHDQLEPGSCAYNFIAFASFLSGGLDVDILERSVNQIIDRHEVLRTVFHAVDGQPMPIILPAMRIDLQVIDVGFAVSGRTGESEFCRIAGEIAGQPFDLTKGPLLRVALLRFASGEHILLLVVHHIVFDAWSTGIFCRELSQIYNSLKNNKPSSLPALRIQYSDFAAWQKNRLQGATLENHISYWKNQLDGLSTLRLPIARSKLESDSSGNAREQFQFPKELLTKLQGLNEQTGTTLFMVLLASYQVALQRYTGQTDIAIGTPTAGRNHPQIEGLIGFFLNMLVLRTDLSANPTFRELLERVRKVCVDAFTHQELPFEKIVEELRPDRDVAVNPLYQITFALQNTPKYPLDLTGVMARDLDNATGLARIFDLHLFMVEEISGLRGYVTYKTSLFQAGFIKRLISHLQNILMSIVANPDQRISDLPMLAELEKQQLLVKWNDTTRDYPKTECIHKLFEAQVERTPDAVVVVCEDKQLSYRELNEQANRVAHYLQRRGVRPEGLVAICMERSSEIIVGLLGILKAGGAYVPLDPFYPKDRLAVMLEDCQASVLVTQQHLLDRLPKLNSQIVCLDRDWPEISQQADANLNSETSAENLAYVTYTSGSTGRPKGVAVSHRAVNRLVMNTDYVALSPKEVVGQASNTSFDAATFEIWGALLNGARLVPIPNDTLLSPEALATVIEQCGLTTLFLTTAFFNHMVERIPLALGRLKHLLFGGEAVDPRRVRELLQNGPPKRLLHVYGPTETTTFASWYRIKTVAPDALTIPIGRPIANTEIYILDPHLNPVPIGVAGEIYIGGVGLARGYLNQPELTAEKFVIHSFDGGVGKRLYKTGDLARYLPDGNIEFLGRLDNQLKIRGFRIEPGEMETVLSQCTGVREAAVIAGVNNVGEKCLVAYVEANGNARLTSQSLRSYLKEKLPEYMIPTAFVFLAGLPLTPNGKLDRRALPEPDWNGREDHAGYVAPRTTVEQVLAEIWADVLGRERVSVHDNFFDLGGYSLMAIRLIAEVCKELQIELPLRQLFECPTIAEFAERVNSKLSRLGADRRASSRWQYLIELKPGSGRYPVFFLPGGVGGDEEFLVYARLTYFAGEKYTFYGLRARSADGKESAHSNVEEMAADYIREIRELQPEGPYFIAAECIGGIVAYEIARQLRLQGQDIGLLVLMDTMCPSTFGYIRYRLRRWGDRWGESYYGVRLRHHFEALKSLSGYARVFYLFTKSKALFRDRSRIVAEMRSIVSVVESEDPCRIKRNYAETLTRYRPKTYEGDVSFLVNENRRSDRPIRRWQKHIKGKLQLKKVPGNHTTYIRLYVRIAGAALRECLDGVTVPAK